MAKGSYLMEMKGWKKDILEYCNERKNTINKNIDKYGRLFSSFES